MVTTPSNLYTIEQQPLYVSVLRALRVSICLESRWEHTHITIQKHALTCLLCRYTTLGLKSVLRLPVSGIVIRPSRRPLTHTYAPLRIVLRLNVLNTYILRIVYALKQTTEGEIRANTRETYRVRQLPLELRRAPNSIRTLEESSAVFLGRVLLVRGWGVWGSWHLRGHTQDSFLCF